ncbi:LRRN4 C-terminal-like protein [Eucyclogobius newberryi]|uniref:LRRN4 C-terminal-like protein n=1 Tax=Eucyclogobius newberryi TaxID=166745 RepID=UPI003B5AB6C4
MQSLCKHLAVLLLFLSTLPYFNSHLFTQAASTSPPVTQSRILFVTALGSDDDYDGDYDNPSIPASVRTPFLYQEPPQLCQYNPCLEDQPSCAVLSQQTGCLCPGLSGASEPPHAPRIHDLLPVNEGPDRGKIEVQWCAPSSIVSGYRVVTEGDEQPQQFKDTKRRGLVGYLKVGTKVCVEAVNKAGHSSPSEFSCKRYEPPTTSDHNLMMVGVLAGAVVLFLLLIIGVVIICKYRICRKNKRDSNDRLGNPSYSAGGTL